MKKYLAQGVTKCDMLNICDFLSLFCPQMRSRDSVFFTDEDMEVTRKLMESLSHCSNNQGEQKGFWGQYRVLPLPRAWVRT